MKRPKIFMLMSSRSSSEKTSEKASSEKASSEKASEKASSWQLIAGWRRDPERTSHPGNLRLSGDQVKFCDPKPSL